MEPKPKPQHAFRLNPSDPRFCYYTDEGSDLFCGQPREAHELRITSGCGRDHGGGSWNANCPDCEAKGR